MPWILFCDSVNFRSFHFLFLTYLTHFFTNSLDCWFIVEPLFSSFFWLPTSSSLALQITFYFTFSYFSLDLYSLVICCLPSNHHYHLPSIQHPPTYPSSLLALICIIKPRNFIITIPCVCQGPWTCWVRWELDSGSGCQWDILEHPLLKLPPPQDLPLKMCYLLHLPLPASWGIFKTFLKISLSLFYVGLDLLLVMVFIWFAAVEGWDSVYWVGAFVSLRWCYLLLLPCLFLASTWWECWSWCVSQSCDQIMWLWEFS